MSLLNFEPSGREPKGGKKSLKLVLGIGALVGSIALGSTLAASINLNSGAPVEFGQGVTQTTSCDDEVTITPFSTFVNDEESADFLFTSFSVTGISASCYGKTFTIKAYSNSDNSPLDLYATDGVSEPFSEVQVLDTEGSFSLVEAGLLSDDIEDVSTGFKVTMVTAGPPASAALASAQDVDRITIESKDSTESTPVTYSVGERGPGGGIVYYVSANFFTSTGSTCDTQCKYLEVAPATWQSAGAIVEIDTYYQWSSNDSVATGQDLQNGNNEGFSSDQKANWQIGKGFYNTSVMKVAGATSAAQAKVLAYAGGSAPGQWFIPSMNELNELCKYASGQTTGDPKVACDSSGNLKTGTANDLGGFIAWTYYSSSESGATFAWLQSFPNGGHYTGNYGKTESYYVRPVRAF
ncbi:unannotated protein [freshwater metagenome]|uniref:Unannotated protein n=1 Tax=freshwater metagenome TaxID=449393 RepID=A0A6J6UEG4_9ZZZZ|nr:DUF1566 domain-containing protein [Actinomycetota bacterium]